MEGDEEDVSQGFLTFVGTDSPENQMKTRRLSMENAHVGGPTILDMISEGSWIPEASDPSTRSPVQTVLELGGYSP